LGEKEKSELELAEHWYVIYMLRNSTIAVGRWVRGLRKPKGTRVGENEQPACLDVRASYAFSNREATWPT
jgi:hypothetical protein